MFFNEQLGSTRSVMAVTMQTNGRFDQSGKIASWADWEDKPRDAAASYLRFVNHISDPFNLSPFLQLDTKIYSRLVGSKLFAKDLPNVYYPEATDLKKIACQLGRFSNQFALVENNIDRVIRDESVAFCDEIEGTFGFPDAGVAEQKNTRFEHTYQYAMQLTFRGASF